MSRDLLAGPALEVAPRLLGAVLTHHSDEGVVGVRLSEVEAYEGEDDPASHAYRGPSARNEVMFGPAGHLYVYLSHGIHWCCNVVTGHVGTASAVLLRAGEVVEGAELARARRGAHVRSHHLARGPGCLGQALGLSREHGGLDLTDPGGPVTLTLSDPVPAAEVSRGPRVGVRSAYEQEWRFWISSDPTVSAYRRNPRAGRA